jgi:hypothetical protein
MGDTIPLLHQGLGLAALAALLLYLRAKRRRQVRDRLDRMERDLPEFLRNPKPHSGRLDVSDADLSLDIHPWGGSPRRPAAIKRR